MCSLLPPSVCTLAMSLCSLAFPSLAFPPSCFSAHISFYFPAVPSLPHKDPPPPALGEVGYALPPLCSLSPFVRLGAPRSWALRADLHVPCVGEGVWGAPGGVMTQWIPRSRARLTGTSVRREGQQKERLTKRMHILQARVALHTHVNNPSLGLA